MSKRDHLEGCAVYDCGVCDCKPLVEVAYCTWEEEDSGEWTTGCGGSHVVLNGTPQENEMTYCCYCGVRIKEVPFAELPSPEEGMYE